MNITAIILAAGMSSRMSRHKLTAEINGIPIIRRAAEAVSQSDIDEIIVVTGYMDSDVCAALEGLAYSNVFNARYESGMGSSIAAGASFLANHSVGAVMICHGDMPFIRTETINTLINTYRRSKAGIIVPYYDDKRGHPVLFDAVYLPDLMELDGQAGARGIIERYKSVVTAVSVSDPGVLIDIDTDENLASGQVYYNDIIRKNQ